MVYFFNNIPNGGHIITGKRHDCMLLTTLDHAPKPQVTHGTNSVNHEHKMVHLGELTWKRCTGFKAEFYVFPLYVPTLRLN